MTHCLHSLQRALGVFRARVLLFAAALAAQFLCWPGAPALAGGLYIDDMTLDEKCLREAYPHAVAGLEREGDIVWLRFQDGRRVVYADASPPVRDADGALREATVQQSMAELYPLGAPDTLTPQGNAGRDRSTALLKTLYGDSAKKLRRATVRLGKETVILSETAAAAFARVVVELEPLAGNPLLARFIFPLGGGLHWRTIANSNRLSSHSFGIAVDLNPDAGPYWRLTPRGDTLYPQKIVEIFERNGFIWGGRWEHFDLMHFEYRPEIICKARLQTPF